MLDCIDECRKHERKQAKSRCSMAYLTAFLTVARRWRAVRSACVQFPNAYNYAECLTCLRVPDLRS